MGEGIARLFAAEGFGGDDACCQGLLGLLQMEQPGLGDPLPALLEGWSEMGREIRPEVALRVGLSVAACQAGRGRIDQARSTLREAWRRFADITDPREMTRASWLEARVLGCLGEPAEALQILESVRQKLLAEPSPAEATLIVSGGFRAALPVVRTFEAQALENNQVVDALADEEGVRELVGSGGNLLDQRIVIAHPENMTLVPADQAATITGSGRRRRRPGRSRA